MRLLFTLTCLLLIAAAPQPANPGKLDPLLKQLKSADSTVRISAIKELADFGPAAALAIPDLIAALSDKDDYLRLNAAITLGKIGKPAIPALAKRIDDKDAAVRNLVISTLAWIGPEAKETTPALLKALKDENVFVRCKAAYALGEFGGDNQEVIAEVLKLLEDDLYAARSASEAAVRFGPPAVTPLRTYLKSKWSYTRQLTISVLGEMGPKAEAAIPDLEVFLHWEEGSESIVAVTALGKMGPSAVKALAGGLKYDDWTFRSCVLASLTGIGPPAEPALLQALTPESTDLAYDTHFFLARAGADPNRILAEAMHGPEGLTRFRAAILIVTEGDERERETARKLLKQTLTHKDINVRVQAARPLAVANEDVHFLWPTLVEGLADANEGTRSLAFDIMDARGQPKMVVFAAAQMLKDEKHRKEGMERLRGYLARRVDDAIPGLIVDLLKTSKDEGFKAAFLKSVIETPNSIEIIPFLREALRFKDAEARGFAATHLGFRANMDKTIILDLSRLLEDINEDVRSSAASALSIQGSVVLPIMVEVLKTSSEEMRAVAADYFMRHKADPKVVVPLLIAALDSKDWQVRASAARAIGNHIPDIEPAIPALTRLLADKDSNVRHWARQTLELQRLKSPEPEVRLAAIQNLADFGSDAAPAIRDLIAALSERDEYLRLNAAITLGKIGVSAVPALVKELKNKDDGVRYYALSALGWAGPGAYNHVLSIPNLLDDPNPEIRRKAVEALGRMRGAANSVPRNWEPIMVAAIVKRFDDQESSVREAAAEAVVQFRAEAIPALRDAIQKGKPAARSLAEKALTIIGDVVSPGIPDYDYESFRREALEQQDISVKPAVDRVIAAPFTGLAAERYSARR